MNGHFARYCWLTWQNISWIEGQMSPVSKWNISVLVDRSLLSCDTGLITRVFVGLIPSSSVVNIFVRNVANHLEDYMWLQPQISFVFICFKNRGRVWLCEENIQLEMQGWGRKTENSGSRIGRRGDLSPASGGCISRCSLSATWAVWFLQ